MQKFVFKIAEGSEANPESFEPLAGGELLDRSAFALGVEKVNGRVGFNLGIHGGLAGLPGPVDIEPEALDEIQVAAGGAKERLPSDSKGFDGLVDGDIRGVGLEGNKVGIVNK